MNVWVVMALVLLLAGLSSMRRSHIMLRLDLLVLVGDGLYNYGMLYVGMSVNL